MGDFLEEFKGRQRERLAALSSVTSIEAHVTQNLERAMPEGWTYNRSRDVNGPAPRLLSWLVFDPTAAPRGGTGNGDRSHTVQVWVDARLFVFLHSNSTTGPLALRHVMRTASVMTFSDYSAWPFELSEFLAHLFRNTEPNFYWPT